MDYKRNILKIFDKLFIFFLIFFPKRSKPIGIVNKILVIKLSAMGDALCLMPSVRLLKHQYPKASIDWLTTKRTNFYLFSNLPFIDRIIVFPINVLSGLFFLVNNFFNLKKYDLIIDFDQYYKLSELVAYMGKFSVGFKTKLKGSKFNLSIFYDDYIHEAYNFYKLSNFNNLNIELYFNPYLPEIIAGFSPGNKLLKIKSLFNSQEKILFIYPGSSDNAKFRRWPLDSFFYVARHFQHSMRIVFAGGPDEINLKSNVERASIKCTDLIGKLELIEWVWFFRTFPESIFLGNDGGLLHLADSQKIPIVGIFGPSLFKKWGSVNPISVPIERVLKCRPCLKGALGQIPSSCWRGDVACLDISPEEVIREINNFHIKKKHVKTAIKLEG